MVSENKNTSRVAAETSDDPTSELEVLSVDLIPTEEELEMDANTFALDADESDNDSVQVLQSDLRSKDERISNLQFDIEQLRSRWAGLEKEISARQELTEILQKDLRAAEKSSRAKEKKLTRAERNLAAATEKLDTTLSAADDYRQQVAELQQQLDAAKEREVSDSEKIQQLDTDLAAAQAALPEKDGSEEKILQSLRSQKSDLQTYIDGRKSDWERQIAELQAATELAESQTESISELRQNLSRSTEDHKASDRELLKVRKALKDAGSREKTLLAEAREQQSRIDHLTNVEQKTSARIIAELKGELAQSNQRISHVDSQVIRSESYADDMRDKLATTQELAADLESRQAQLQSSLDAATETITELQGQLEFERDRTATLQTLNESQEQEFSLSTESLRTEVEESRTAIAEHQLINEQLTSDLIDSRSFGQALEQQCESANATHDAELKVLRRRIRDLETQSEDNERKLGNKDNAISALLNELASKSRTLESIDEIENVIHEIDDLMSEKIDDRVVGDRDRPTRLLVGEVDGQELRFPLFKDRLTIGRTVQNDIQLRAHHISRRHAVIISDSEGTRIVDWGSKNGVYVNGVRTAEQSLSSGDKVTIGTAEFVYEELLRRPAD